MAIAQSLPAFSAALSRLAAESGSLSPVASRTFVASGTRFGVSGPRLNAERCVNARARRPGGDEDVDLAGEKIADDYYSVLGVTPDATPDEIRKAYYSCMKVCHPDLSGNHPETTAFCMFINEVYEVLIDPDQRMVYDEINGYALTAVNPFLNEAHEKDHSFVDEFSCIGCKNCANTAPNTFDIEMEFGRARVVSQTGDHPSLVQRAIDTCPVDCIHWVTPAQLTLLEDEMRRMERVNVGMMLCGMGSGNQDVFGQASWRWEKRQARTVEKARRRMMQEQGAAWWDGLWSPVSGAEESRQVDTKVARERAARTAAAARRWREYSKQGLDRRATKVLAAARSLEEEEEEKPSSV